MITKGKWIVGAPYDNGTEYPICNDEGYELARVFIHNGEQEANAKLISASPDLNEALKAMLLNRELGEYESQKQGKPRMIEVNNMAREALSKVE